MGGKTHLGHLAFPLDLENSDGPSCDQGIINDESSFLRFAVWSLCYLNVQMDAG